MKEKDLLQMLANQHDMNPLTIRALAAKTESNQHQELIRQLSAQYDINPLHAQKLARRALQTNIQPN
jgi:hypothetical protein